MVSKAVKEQIEKVLPNLPPEVQAWVRAPSTDRSKAPDRGLTDTVGASRCGAPRPTASLRFRGIATNEKGQDYEDQAQLVALQGR